MTTRHDDKSFDLGAALHDIAADAGDLPGDPTWAAATHTAAARRRRRNHTTVAAVTVAVLALGGGAWATIPTMLHDPLPAITHTPTPSPSISTPPPSPTPTPSPTPSETSTPEPPPVAVPDGYATDRIDLPPKDSDYVYACGQQLPAQTGTDRLVTASVPAATVTMRSDQTWVEVPVTYHVPDTVKLRGNSGTVTPRIAQGGLILSNLGYVPSGDLATFDGTPGQIVQGVSGQGVDRMIGCNASVMDDMFEGQSLSPGTYTVALVIQVTVNEYSLQQQDGSWGAWQQAPNNWGGGPADAGSFVHVVTNSFTLVVE